MDVLVSGATGFVGSRLVPALLDANHDVTVLTRDADGYSGPEEVSVVEDDILESDDLRQAFENSSVAYYLVHSLESGMDFAERDRKMAANFAETASESGIERVIYLGGLGEEDGESEELSKHLRSRREVEKILEGGDYALTTLRAAIIIGNGSASFEMVRQLAARLPVMVTPKWVRTKCQPVAIDDVIEYFVKVLETPNTAGEAFEIGGPMEITYQDLLQRTARILGNQVVILPVPVLTPKLSTYWVELVTTVPQNVVRPLILGQKNTVVVNSSRIEELVSIDLTPYDVAIERAIDDE